MKSHDTYVEECAILNIEVIDTYIDSSTPIRHRCMDCGTMFTATPSNVLSEHTGCPHCRRSKSSGERFLESWLSNNNINFQPECSVIINEHRHFFDFFLSDFEIFIEYDGKQHYEAIDFWGGEKQFKKQQERDAEKNQWCADNGYRLIRIKYDVPFEEVADMLYAELIDN